MANDRQTSVASSVVARSVLAASIVLLAGAATYVLFRSDFWRSENADRSSGFTIDLTDQLEVDSQLIDYQQTGSIDLNMGQLHGIAIGPQDRIYVAGDRSLHVYAADGQLQDEVDFDSRPLCLVVAGDDEPAPGRLFVAMSDGIKILGADLQAVATWELPADNVLPTSIAVSGEDVFVADANNRIVWRYNTAGEVIGQIGKPDSQRNIPGFVVSHFNFDIVAGSEGLLYVVNPGKLQISTFSFDGDLGNSWGRAGSSIADFFGCCNPVHVARFADGSFVTSEKGIPRIKVYSAAGEMRSVVAGPEQLGIRAESLGDPRQGTGETVFDIAVDSRGRVLVLDPRTKSVRIFSLKEP